VIRNVQRRRCHDSSARYSVVKQKYEEKTVPERWRGSHAQRGKAWCTSLEAARAKKCARNGSGRARSLKSVEGRQGVRVRQKALQRVR
jgi:hypothetical protein